MSGESRAVRSHIHQHLFVSVLLQKDTNYFVCSTRMCHFFSFQLQLHAFKIWVKKIVWPWRKLSRLETDNSSIFDTEKQITGTENISGPLCLLFYGRHRTFNFSYIQIMNRYSLRWTGQQDIHWSATSLSFRLFHISDVGKTFFQYQDQYIILKTKTSKNVQARQRPFVSRPRPRPYLPRQEQDQDLTFQDKNKTNTLPSKNKTKTLPSKNNAKTLPSKNETNTLPSKNNTKTLPSKNKTMTLSSKTKTKTLFFYRQLYSLLLFLT